MIDRVSKHDLLNLVQKQNDPCVTICLGTEKTGREIYKPAARLKKLAKTAQQKLAGHWMGESDATTFMQPVIELAQDHQFWQETERGLVMFLSADGFQKWRIASPVTEQLFVSSRFFVSPLVKTANSDQQFFLLSLSRSKVELFDANESSIVKLNVPNLPANLESALNLTSVERGVQSRTGSREGDGKNVGVFHGHGGKSETSKQDLKHYFRQINLALSSYLTEKRQPMILCCVSDQASVFREVNSYPYLMVDVVTGNTDRITENQLHQQASPIMREYARTVRQSAIETFRQNANTSRTSSEISAILAATHEGRVDQLFFDESARLPGEFNSIQQTIDYHASSSDVAQDLIEDAIAQTLLHRGKVFALISEEMPDEETMVATLRY